MEYEILNSRKVNVKAIININGSVRNQFEHGLVCDFQGVDGVQILRSAADVNSYIGSSEIICPVHEILEIPAGKPTIREILRNDIKITGKDYKLTDSKVIAKGELNVSTLYIGDDESRGIQTMEHEIPFTQFIDLPGLNEDSTCRLEYRITDSAFSAEEDSDGELRRLKGEVSVNVFAEGYGRKEIELIEDAYSPASRMSLEKESFTMEDLVAENKGQMILKETVEINEDSPDIAEVFNILGKLSLSECRITDDRIFIEGVLGSSILYLAGNNEQPVFCCSREIPFKHSMDVKGVKTDMKCNVDMNMEHCSYSMISAREVEIRLVILIAARVTDHVTMPVVAKVTEVPLDDKRLASQPSITIYFAQQGDTLWNVAKKYYTTIDEIKKINNISDNDALNPGAQVIIPKRTVLQ